MPFDDVQVPRQHVIRGAGLVLTAGALAACGSESDKPAASSESSSSSAPAEAPGGAIAKTADVPVGS
ncbi:MAG TPA: Rieske (2Fe-2S) protein, partial [Mycobacterium sp.]|nr:Rieske (2Fe-2S) protein [Mycobacterium sp.]